MSSVGTKRLGLKGNERKKKKTNQGDTATELDMVKIEKTRLICGQQLRTQPRGEPKAVCPCWEMCTCLWWGVCTSHHWLAEEKMTFSSLWTLQGSKNFVLMCVWGAWKSQVLISDRDPWAPARRLILKTRLQRSRSNMASCAGWQQESAISVVRGLSNISFAAMHYRKTSTGKVLHICHEKKKKQTSSRLSDELWDINWSNALRYRSKHFPHGRRVQMFALLLCHPTIRLHTCGIFNACFAVIHLLHAAGWGH